MDDNPPSKTSICKRKTRLIRGVDVDKLATDIARIYPIGSAFDAGALADYAANIPSSLENRIKLLATAESAASQRPLRKLRIKERPRTASIGNSSTSPSGQHFSKTLGRQNEDHVKQPVARQRRPFSAEENKILDDAHCEDAKKTRATIEMLHQKIRGQSLATSKMAVVTENESKPGPVAKEAADTSGKEISNTPTTSAIIPESAMRILRIPPDMRSAKEIDGLGKAIRELKALASCAQQIIAKLCSVCRVESHYGIVFSQGDEPLSWYIILDGAVDIYIKPKVAQTTVDSAAKPAALPPDYDVNLGKKIVTLKAGYINLHLFFNYRFILHCLMFFSRRRGSQR